VSVRYNIERPGVIAIENFGNFCQAVFEMGRPTLEYRSAKPRGGEYRPSRALRFALGSIAFLVAAIINVMSAYSTSDHGMDLALLLGIPSLIWAGIGFTLAIGEMRGNHCRLRWTALAIFLSSICWIIWGLVLFAYTHPLD
jgi:hypothetical protein